MGDKLGKFKTYGREYRDETRQERKYRKQQQSYIRTEMFEEDSTTEEFDIFDVIEQGNQ